MVWSLKAQNSEKMFSEAVLSNPMQNAFWFDSCIILEEIPVFVCSDSNLYVMVENGYSIYNLKQPEVLMQRREFTKPASISIVYTKYPLKKEDWVTNYYELLANRLKELFTVDSSLNDNSITWRFIMQTEGKTEDEAIKLFHGIFISYQNEYLSPLASILSKPLLVGMGNTIKETPCMFDYTRITETISPIPDAQAILYPESIEKKGIKPTTPQKNEKIDEPPCPKFPTRMDRAKKSFLGKLFHR